MPVSLEVSLCTWFFHCLFPTLTLVHSNAGLVQIANLKIDLTDDVVRRLADGKYPGIHKSVDDLAYNRDAFLVALLCVLC